MSLRVAFDMDGTVADMRAALRREADRLFGADAAAAASPAESSGGRPAAVAATAAPVVTGLPLTERQHTQLWEHVRRSENFWTTLPEIEAGIIARIAALARERRWEVLFITTRPSSAGDTTQVQTQRWLDAHGFTWPSVCVVQRSRGRLADALQLDAVVDDRPENSLDVAVESRARPILIWPDADAPLPGGLKRMGVRPVASIGEALEQLTRMDDSRRHSGVVGSIRRLLKRDR